jgi:hypothetical protein
MSCQAWLVAGLIALAGDLAQALPPPPPIPPQPAARSGAQLLGRPGIRTRYVDPSGPAPSAGGQKLPTVDPPQPPLAVPVNERVDFTPTMEEGPFQRPTLRGLFRWDLQQPASR